MRADFRDESFSALCFLEVGLGKQICYLAS